MMTDHSDLKLIKLSDYLSATPQFPADKMGTWLSVILQSSTDGVIVIDTTGQIVVLNREAHRMFGYGAQQILGETMGMLLPVRLHAEYKMHMNRFASTYRNDKRLQVKFDLIGVRANGEEFLIEASVSRITVRDEIFIAIILRETTQTSGNTPAIASEDANLRKIALSSQQANEVEKRRFSKELYDDLGQRLSVLKLDLDWLENSMLDRDDSVPMRIAQMQRLLSNIISRTKSIAHTLRPPLLDDFGLLPAVEWITDNFRKKTSITCIVEMHDFRIKPGDLAESAIFRVIQESLLNVERHAKASQVKIILQRNDSHLYIEIQDDGVGMINSDARKPGCYGLIAMQERVYILGGSITTQNITPRGFAICASIPIQATSD